MLAEVVKYHLDSYGHSIDPNWWSCRYSDMCVYSQILHTGHRARGCMMMTDYPFDVWKFIETYSERQFLAEVVSQVTSNLSDEYFKQHIVEGFKKYK